MKEVILHNWRAKLASLLLAFAIWYLIDNHVTRSKIPGRYPVPDGPVPGQGALPPALPDFAHIA